MLQCKMTLEEKENSSSVQRNAALGGEDGNFAQADFPLPQREKPVIHAAVDPLICDTCQKLEIQFFDPGTVESV